MEQASWLCSECGFSTVHPLRCDECGKILCHDCFNDHFCVEYDEQEDPEIYEEWNEEEEELPNFSLHGFFVLLP